ncbi:acylneuraminate cytidylyltransferase family protein [Neobacillus endophyticus]|uniref:acylneuraminate cytidylyltransferase family protein n=1 Tax=Neobacillus endophyticus TaxID=2738405 RepID=UPI001C270522|nr:acylneuraminate cytidylyltransferase family protein [Neobacillus endophyticus]
MNGKRNIAIIPARSGSKGLKDKNILELKGKPLIAYTIEAAINSGCFDMVMVSTDSEKYAEISRKYGAEVPFLRSKSTSEDCSSSWDVVREVLSRLSKIGKEFDIITLLQPTSPLRNCDDIRAAIELFNTKNASYVTSICEAEHSPLLCNTIDESLSMNGFLNMENLKRRQELPLYYRLNGAIYIIKKTFLESGEFFYGLKSFAYIMPNERSIDIDTKLDFIIAESVLNS